MKIVDVYLMSALIEEILYVMIRAKPKPWFVDIMVGSLKSTGK
jgi:hypothetical protein